MLLSKTGIRLRRFSKYAFTLRVPWSGPSFQVISWADSHSKVKMVNIHKLRCIR